MQRYNIFFIYASKMKKKIGKICIHKNFSVSLRPISKPHSTMDTLSPTDELQSLRAEIDAIDNELWQLIARRMDVSRRIGEYKRQNAMRPLQPARYEQILTQRLQWAQTQGISAETVRAIMEAIHTESVRVQL